MSIKKISLLALLLPGIGFTLWAVMSQGKQRDQNITAPSIVTVAGQYPVQMMDYLGALKDSGLDVEYLSEDELPPSLIWENGAQEQEIGDPAAKKGGIIRRLNVGPYPQHLRRFGDSQLVFFHYTLYTQVELPLVTIHPNTHSIIPAVAESWASSGTQGECIYFRINPAARYSNGQKIRARDYLLSIYLRSSPHCQNSLYLPNLLANVEKVSAYGDRYLQIKLKKGGLLAPQRAASFMHADEPSFYAEFGSDFLERYSQRIPPTTGAYVMDAQNSERGRKITMNRLKNWWARELPFYKYRFNPDKLEHHFLSDESQAWEFFLRGKLDIMQTRNVAAWQDRLEHHRDVREGRIERHTFLANYPLPPYGIYLNTAQIPDINLRRGIMHALDMNSALGLIFRNEYERLSCFSEGYGSLSPKNIGQYQYKPIEARAYFKSAGYSQQDSDGILKNSNGKRLSLTLSYTPSDKVSTLMRSLKASAARCGLEIKLEPLPWQSCGKKVESKKYELTFWADVAVRPLPDLAPLFHSEFIDEYGKNLHSTEDEELDSAIEEMQSANTFQHLAAATKRANQRIYELALWLPGWKENRAYVASWRNIRFPNSPECQVSTPMPYGLSEAHLFWVDPEFKRRGKYPEVDRLVSPKITELK